MRKSFVFLFILSLMLFSACNVLKPAAVAAPTVAAQPNVANDQVNTRVAQILTVAATQNIKVDIAKGAVVEAATQAPTAVPPTATPAPTQTPAPTETPSQTPVPTLTATPLPTATVGVMSILASAKDPRSLLGPPTSGDPMDNANLWVWPTGHDKLTSADWRNGSMQVTALTKTTGWRLPMVGPLQNVYIEMTARANRCSGLDNYGIYFHVPELRHPVQGYWFVISCDGSYRLSKWDGYHPDEDLRYSALINWTPSPAIRRGQDQPNRLGVMLYNDTISLYVNGTYLGTYRDESYPIFPSGHFGVMVNSKVTKHFSVDVDEMAYWANPK